MENQEQNQQRGSDEKITPQDLVFSRKAEDKKQGEAEEKEKSPLRLKAENFLYYYKWPVLAGLFVVFVIVICTLQTCRKTSPDAYVLYAGAQDVGKVGQNGDVSEYEVCLSSLRLFAEDTDGDGNKVVSLETLYLLSPEEKAALQAELSAGGNRYSLNEVQLSENATALTDQLLAGDVYFCILSEYWLDQYDVYFCDLTPYVPKEGEPVLTESGLGIYLSSTALGKKPGFDSFPEDTVICLRKISAVGGKRAAENFESAEKMLEAVLR